MKHSFDFALTTYCQAKCRSCARTHDDTGEKQHWLPLQHMNLDQFRNTLESANNKITYDMIEFCGEFGDPMMHPKVDNFIETALNYAPLVEISTNGGLRNSDWYASIGEKYKNKCRIWWALDGATHDVNWLYREGVDFNKAIDNLTAFTKAGGWSTWMYLIFDWNWHQVAIAKQMADELGIAIIFRYNNRSHGLITDTNMKLSKEFNKQHDIKIGFEDDM
jgi:hypothetical protein|tara:strand:- start:2766 stop:3425 length:660 start_codon:yes stop_codon:yes gene_type:complete